VKAFAFAIATVLCGSAAAADLTVTPPPGLPSTEVVQAWLHQDPSVQEAQAGLEAAQHAAGMLRASTHEFTTRVASQRRRYDVGPDSKEWTAQLERAIRLPGKGATDRRLGDTEIALAEAEFGEAIHEAAKDFVTLWMDWQGAKEARVLLEEQVRFGEESLRVVASRKRAGDASTLEANVVEADTAETRAQLSLAVTTEQKAEAKLRTRFPGSEQAALTLAEPGTIEQPLTQWNTRIQSTSDELKIAQLHYEKAQLTADRARADRVPDPTLGVYASSEAFGGERVIGVSLSVPLPGRYRSERLGQALSPADMAKSALDRQEREVTIAVDAAYREATGSYERWKLAEASAARTRDNATLTQRAYSLGEGDLQTLLLARRQAVTAADVALSARVSALRAYYTLLVDAHLIWGLEHD